MSHQESKFFFAGLEGQGNYKKSERDPLSFRETLNLQCQINKYLKRLCGLLSNNDRQQDKELVSMRVSNKPIGYLWCFFVKFYLSNRKCNHRSPECTINIQYTTLETTCTFAHTHLAENIE